MSHHVSKAEFGVLVERALAELPDQFAELMEEIAIEVHDRPGAARSKGMETGGHLLMGLYVGRPRTMRSVMDEMPLPDVIYLFQRNIEEVCNSEQELVEETRKTVLHEIGHHFGMSEEDLEKLGYG